MLNEKEMSLSSNIYKKFQEAMISKSPETKTWKTAYEAYYGTLYKNQSKADYKSDIVVNIIFKTIETIRPIMIDNNPRFVAMARTKEGSDRAEVIQKAMDFEWDRESVSKKLYANLIPNLVTGNAIFYIPWDAGNGKEGNIRCIPVDPYNFYIDPLANNIQDAEYVIYATYKNVNQLKKLFPDKAEDIVGSAIKYSELVAQNDRNASSIDNQVLVLEIWMNDYSTSTFDGVDSEGKSVKFKKREYPNGRMIVCAPELGVTLTDKPNPYKDGKKPFVQMKNYDIPFKFWGKGDVEQLLSPQHYMNELNNQIIDNAKLTANVQWIVDKNAGIPVGTLTNRQGLIIRKNPGSDVSRPAPPSMPSYVNDKVLELKRDMEVISGVHDASAGQRPVGIQSGTAIANLQEAGQTRIRLKVKLMEDALSEMATMWYSRMQQFWKTERYVRTTKEEGIVEFDKVTISDLALDYDVRICAGSTMPNDKQSKLQRMIQLGQILAEDGKPMVDRRAILEFVDLKDKKGLIDRMDKLSGQGGTIEQQFMQFQEQYQQDKQQTVQIIQELTKEVKGIANQMSAIESKWEGITAENEKLKIARDAKSKGYEEGLKEIPPDLKPEEQLAMQNLRDKKENDTFEEEVRSGKIPDSVLAELEQLPPEELKALLEQYPELEQMLNDNINANNPQGDGMMPPTDTGNSQEVM
jgi:hypothetical protein